MPSAVHRLSATTLVVVALIGAGTPSLLLGLSGIAAATVGPDHLVISEVVTGGTSASDELIEIYNPSAGPLPLEGLEAVYITASGLTVSRRATWEAGAPEVPPGGHVLIAHELGVYASIADQTYGSGMASTGGSVALRIVGAASAIDAVGWGSAASTWLEGTVASAPPPGSSLERLPGGAFGSTQDTDDNAADFALRSVPGPENTASPAVPDPAASASPSAAATTPPEPTPAATASPPPTPSPTPGPLVVPIATARSLPDGSEVTIEGIALTDSGFADGGGYVADGSGGLAVLLGGGSFDRGDRLRISGEIDDRYAQRTLRADGAGVVMLGTGADPAPIQLATGVVGEDVEGRLVRIAGTVVSSPTVLSSGTAFEVDDGSGSTRLLIGAITGIDVGDWKSGFSVDTVGVVGQRDSSGTGTSGYRVQPRDVADILAVGPGASPTASPGASATPPATPEPSPSPGVISVAAARQLPKGAEAVVRGVVTLAPGLVDPTTAALQDATGAIVLRVGDEAGPVTRGSMVEVRGVRSTLSGMETLRISTPPRSLGAGAEPVPQSVRTGEAGEPHEATLVIVRGGLVAAPRRSPAGTTSFEIDDGSGPLRISIGSSAGIEAAALASGTWIEVRGVLGQETTGSLPLRGYRVWPRVAADVRVVAPATTGAATGDGPSGADGSVEPISASLDSLDAVGGSAGTGLPVGATLVVGPWEELGVGGLLWDGARLVAIHADAAQLVTGALGRDHVPVSVQASGLRIVGIDASTGIPVAAVPDEPGALVPSGLPPSPPLATLDGAGAGARWVSLVGRLGPRSTDPGLLVEGTSLPIDRRCGGEPLTHGGTVSVTGILVGEPPRLVVPCGGFVPAPLLASARMPGSAHARLAPLAVAPVDDTDSPPGPLAAVLLLLAGAVLASGAAAARWASRGAARAPEGEPVGPGAADEAEAPPSLTLVPLPRERAP